MDFGIRNIGRVSLDLLIISFVVSSLLISPLTDIFKKKKKVKPS